MGLSGRYWLYLELQRKSQMCPNRGASPVVVSDFDLKSCPLTCLIPKYQTKSEADRINNSPRIRGHPVHFRRGKQQCPMHKRRYQNKLNVVSGTPKSSACSDLANCSDRNCRKQPCIVQSRGEAKQAVKGIKGACAWLGFL
jgi:hypothetical protein